MDSKGSTSYEFMSEGSCLVCGGENILLFEGAQKTEGSRLGLELQRVDQ